MAHSSNITFLILFCLFCSCYTNPIIDGLNKEIQLILPDINTSIQSNVPSSIGNCNDNNPPQPCQCIDSGCDYLYFIHQKYEYEAYARWITGLRTGSLTSIVLSAEDGGKTITVSVTGLFQELPVSLWIGECFTFDRCVKIWDNEDGCCGTNKHFQVFVSVSCVNTTYPFLNNIRVDNVTVDKFEITEKIVGININIIDITNSIEAAINSFLSQYLTTVKWIPYNGTMVTVVDWANGELQQHLKGFSCPLS
eukprot:TRINITY_DN87_c1_g1_i1.p1 TRINITY_DN87_c1_g1~~TRINITY_DN87_c1_g1_i1.p1  ORF type:complete len:251 (+),score=34.10 TRINITY_DN87_c1_g1_i1:58-810(+)